VQGVTRPRPSRLTYALSTAAHRSTWLGTCAWLCLVLSQPIWPYLFPPRTEQRVREVMGRRFRSLHDDPSATATQLRRDRVDLNHNDLNIDGHAQKISYFIKCWVDATELPGVNLQNCTMIGTKTTTKGGGPLLCVHATNCVLVCMAHAHRPFLRATPSAQHARSEEAATHGAARRAQVAGPIASDNSAAAA
jgi:hypothetical protein